MIRGWSLTAPILLTGALLLGALGAPGCGESAPGTPIDNPALAGLRLFLEIDYVAAQLRQTDRYVGLWETEVLWGIQEASCGFVYDQFTDPIDVQITIDKELDWGSSIGEEAGIYDYTDEEGILQAVSNLLVTEKTQNERKPNLYLVIADHLISKTETSKDPDRPFDTYRFDDSVLPPAADILGFVTWPPANEFLGCDGDSYDSDSPVGVVFLGAIEKFVADVNVVLQRELYLEPSGCGLTGNSLVSFERVAAKVIGHELIHEIGLVNDIDPTPDLTCHEPGLRVIHACWPTLFAGTGVAEVVRYGSGGRFDSLS